MMLSSSFHLAIKRKSHYGLTARLTKGVPALARDEVAVKIEVSLPAALFQRPALCASVTIPEGTSLSETITADVADNVAEIIRQQTGLVVNVVAAEDDSSDT